MMARKFLLTVLSFLVSTAVATGREPVAEPPCPRGDAALAGTNWPVPTP